MEKYCPISSFSFQTQFVILFSSLTVELYFSNIEVITYKVIEINMLAFFITSCYNLNDSNGVHYEDSIVSNCWSIFFSIVLNNTELETSGNLTADCFKRCWLYILFCFFLIYVHTIFLLFCLTLVCFKESFLLGFLFIVLQYGY